jgi:predicted dienelactone hydrolase
VVVLSRGDRRTLGNAVRDAILHQSTALQRRRDGAGRRHTTARHVLPWPRQQRPLLRLVRRVPGRAGYIVAALDHYRANSYDATIAYLANKLWQRPLDIGLGITFLLDDPFWGSRIDAARIGVAGHSQGGFTALWVGGAKVDADRYLEFQRRWRSNQMVPEHLRKELPLDARPALEVHDQRVKAVFAMAPGVIQAFGMDEAGLRQLGAPTYIIVGASDTQTPPEDNAEFAARYVPNAELDVLPGRVDHEIFVNQCNEIGKDEFPEACIDAPEVDRAAIHQTIGDAAVRFFDGALRVTRPN